MRTYTPEFKARVIAEWLAGSTQNELAGRFHIPKSTVSTWTMNYPRIAPVPDTDLTERFARSVYNRAMEALDALGSHLRAAAKPEFAGVVEGWTDRAAGLSKVVVTLGAAIQRGSAEPIAIEAPDEPGSVGGTDQ